MGSSASRNYDQNVRHHDRMDVDDFGRIATDKSGENFDNYDIIDVRELG